MYNVTNISVATVAATRVLLRDKTFPIRVATKTKIAETVMFAKFKRDQSMDRCWLLFIVQEDALHVNLVAERSSSIDE